MANKNQIKNYLGKKRDYNWGDYSTKYKNESTCYA